MAKKKKQELPVEEKPAEIAVQYRAGAPVAKNTLITEKAAELFCAGFAKYVIPTGAYSGKRGKFAAEKIDNSRYAGEYATDFEYCRYILKENGVPESAILREDRSTNTGENAEFTAILLRKVGLPVRKAILCCQSFHARRAFMSYAKFFPDTEIFVVPTDTQGIRKEDWFRQEKSYRRVMSEVQKCGEYFLEYPG